MISFVDSSESEEPDFEGVEGRNGLQLRRLLLQSTSALFSFRLPTLFTFPDKVHFQ